MTPGAGQDPAAPGRAERLGKHVEQARAERILEALLSSPETRASSQSVVEAILESVADLDPDDAVPEWLVECSEGVGDEPPANVGELRDRLRARLSEIAARDA